MSSLLAPLSLVIARARRRPGRWVWPLVGLSMAVGFAGAVAGESVVAADQAARVALRGLSPLDRAVRVTWQGPVTPTASAGAREFFRGLGLGGQTQVTLLNPVRLSGVIVRPAGIAPLGRWLPVGAARLARCRSQRCPALLAGGGSVPAELMAAGVHINVLGRETLRSDVPLAYAPSSESQWPLLLTGDPAGLDQVSGLSGVYRTHSWVAELNTTRLHSWLLAVLERRLARAQAKLLEASTQFGVAAPFDGLNAARARAAAAPGSLLLAGGGAIAALALFVVLAAAGMREERLSDLARLRISGATTAQLGIFVAGEAIALCAAALVLGLIVAVAATAVLAGEAGEPLGEVLAHSLITPAAGVAVAGGWIVASALVALATQLRSPLTPTLAAVGATVALVAGLVVGRRDAGASVVLLAPVCCLAGGVVIFRAATWLLRALERASRRGPISTRLALVGLARAPALPALAIAFLAVSVALGGFALAYRATLERGAADQAADRVPLDAIVSPGASFTTPTQLAPLPRWRQLSRGLVFPVRRAQASYQSGSSAATVPALGVPARALSLMHGWRASDGHASLTVLARQLETRRAVRLAGPELPAATRRLSIAAYSPQLAVAVTADLRDPTGEIRQIALGTASTTRRLLRARVPQGRWELEALELDEGSGLAITNGHQNGESATPATQFTARLELGPLYFASNTRRATERVRLGSWIGVGAAAVAHPSGSGTATVQFATSGMPGIVRPRQPSDFTAVPVLTDRQTAAAAGPDGRLSLDVDGQPVQARVVGVLARFPTLSGASGFVVADEPVLASALEAQLPGQGRPDELWVSGQHLGALPRALRAGPLDQLQTAFRSDIESALRRAPIARALAGTQLAAAALSAVLAVLGLLLVLHGPFRDRRFEEDLEAQGLRPAGLRAELRTRLAVAAALGIPPGVALALLLDKLAVAAVGSSLTGQPPEPPVVAVVPAGQLFAWAAGLAVLLLGAGWAATRRMAREPVRRRDPAPTSRATTDDALREGWAR